MRKLTFEQPSVPLTKSFSLFAKQVSLFLPLLPSAHPYWRNSASNFPISELRFLNKEIGCANEPIPSVQVPIKEMTFTTSENRYSMRKCGRVCEFRFGCTCANAGSLVRVCGPGCAGGCTGAQVRVCGCRECAGAGCSCSSLLFPIEKCSSRYLPGSPKQSVARIVDGSANQHSYSCLDRTQLLALGKTLRAYSQSLEKNLQPRCYRSMA